MNDQECFKIGPVRKRLSLLIFGSGVYEKDGAPYSIAVLCVDKVPRLRLEGAPNRIPRPSSNLRIESASVSRYISDNNLSFPMKN
jgi:hypothetical protein